MTGTKYCLGIDAVSIFSDKKGNPKVYGKKGERVTLISTSHPAAIVENKTGERYPVSVHILKEC